MVDINPNASALQAQLQAQLQSGKSASMKRAEAFDQGQQSQQTGQERASEGRGDGAESRQLVVKKSTRNIDLSSQQELEAAQQRVSSVAGNTREAPIGRTSTLQSELRNQPLGQIIDIRV